MIGRSATEFDLIQLMREKKIPTLRDHGLEKILKGETTVAEVLRVAL
jgi:type II secretory ATPase GspE/PulE/Tfp pilus assembly ATPase PilB-like protein